MIRTMLGLDDAKTLAIIMRPQVLSIFEEDYMLKSKRSKKLWKKHCKQPEQIKRKSSPLLHINILRKLLNPTSIVFTFHSGKTETKSDKHIFHH